MVVHTCTLRWGRFPLLIGLLVGLGIAFLWSLPAHTEPLGPVLDVRISPESPIAGEPFRVVVESQSPGIRQITPMGDAQLQVLRQMASVQHQVGPQGAVSTSRFEFTLRQNTPGELGLRGFRIETTQGPATVPWSGPPVRPADGSGTSPPPTLANPPAAPPRAQQAPRSTGGQAAQDGARPPRPGSSAMHWGPLDASAAGEPKLVLSSSHQRAWLGEPIVVDILLLLPIGQGDWSFVEFDAPIFEGFWFRHLERQRRPRGRGRLGTESVRNELHEIYYITSFELVALQAGRLELPGGTLLLERRGRIRGQQPLELVAQPFPLEVTAPPREDLPAGTHVLGTGVERASLAYQRSHLREGERLEATLTLAGTGLASRWSPPSTRAFTDWQVDRPEVSTEQREASDGWLEGQSIITWRAEPARDGELPFGPLHLASWDPREERWKTWELDAFQVRVEGARAATSAADEESPSASIVAAIAPILEGTESTSVFDSPPLRSALFWTLATLPLLLLMGTEGKRFIRRRAKSQAALPNRRRNELLESLHGALHPSSGVLWSLGVKLAEEALAIDLDRPVRGQTRETLLECARDLPSTSRSRATALLQLLDDAERSRFGGSDVRFLPPAWAQRFEEALRCGDE